MVFLDMLDSKRLDFAFLSVAADANTKRARHFLESLPGLASFLRFASSGPLYTIFSKPGPALFKPGYPREPQGFGEWLRRLRLNHGLLIKDFASWSASARTLCQLGDAGQEAL